MKLFEIPLAPFLELCTMYTCSSRGDKGKAKEVGLIKMLNINEQKVFNTLKINAGNETRGDFTTEFPAVEGLTQNQIKGYLSSLQAKKMIICDQIRVIDLDSNGRYFRRTVNQISFYD